MLRSPNNTCCGYLRVRGTNRRETETRSALTRNARPRHRPNSVPGTNGENLKHQDYLRFSLWWIKNHVGGGRGTPSKNGPSVLSKSSPRKSKSTKALNFGHILKTQKSLQARSWAPGRAHVAPGPPPKMHSKSDENCSDGVTALHSGTANPPPRWPKC